LFTSVGPPDGQVAAQHANRTTATTVGVVVLSTPSTSTPHWRLELDRARPLHPLVQPAWHHDQATSSAPTREFGTTRWFVHARCSSPCARAVAMIGSSARLMRRLEDGRPRTAGAAATRLRRHNPFVAVAGGRQPSLTSRRVGNGSGRGHLVELDLATDVTQPDVGPGVHVDQEA
jgi:hypothetical protein